MIENVLPDCRLSRTAHVVLRDGESWVPVFCANCHVEGPQVMAKSCTFAFWLCNGCADKWGTLAGTYLMPDELFFTKVHNVQLEEFGRPLQEQELIEALKDEHSPLSKVARDRPHKE